MKKVAFVAIPAIFALLGCGSTNSYLANHISAGGTSNQNLQQNALTTSNPFTGTSAGNATTSI
jgi:hypothetical protein